MSSEYPTSRSKPYFFSFQAVGDKVVCHCVRFESFTFDKADCSAIRFAQLGEDFDDDLRIQKMFRSVHSAVERSARKRGKK